VSGPIALWGSFNEFELAVEARYAGGLLELPERRPTPDEIAHGEEGVRQLAGFLLRHNADRSSATRCRPLPRAVQVPSLSDPAHSLPTGTSARSVGSTQPSSVGATWN
jgi:hypothetical protein